MEPLVIQGLWDEVAPEHAAHLMGHRVEIRVLYGGNAAGVPDDAAFRASRLRISALMSGAAQIRPEPLRAEDFYESDE